MKYVHSKKALITILIISLFLNVYQYINYKKCNENQLDIIDDDIEYFKGFLSTIDYHESNSVSVIVQDAKNISLAVHSYNLYLSPSSGDFQIWAFLYNSEVIYYEQLRMYLEDGIDTRDALNKCKVDFGIIRDEIMSNNDISYEDLKINIIDKLSIYNEYLKNN